MAFLPRSRRAVLALLAAQCGFLVLLGVSLAAASGRAYSVKWAAADPSPNSGAYAPTYAKIPPAQQACPTPSGSAGRAADPLPDAVYSAPSGANDSVSSLTPKDMSLGQI